jgi:hypothetical protein
MTKYQKYARATYKLGKPIDEMWHPEIIAECKAMQAEEVARLEALETKKNKNLQRIGEVVESVADISQKFTGNIVVRCSFTGSLAKTKKLTRDEKALVFNLPPDVKAPIAGDKELFTSKEYDALVKFIQDARGELERMGIPHINFKSAQVVSIMRIPDVEEWAERTQVKLDELVDKLIEVYPDQITPEATKLGPLYNPNDYRAVEALRTLFKFDYSFISVGVPNELKAFNVQLFKKMQKQALETWKQIEANGVLVLRKAVTDLVGGLVESLTDKSTGEKKKFHASSVTKITEFIDNFKGRNICGDAELDAEVEKLRGLVEGIDPDKLSAGDKGDEAMREKVRKSMEGMAARLKPLLIAAESRVINLND